MGDNEVPLELDPLLEQEQAPWEAIDDVEGGHQGVIKLSRLFASRPDDVIKILQSKGVIKLGEFTERSNIVLPAFKDAILTIGSQHRFIDYEQVWREELKSRHTSKKASTKQDKTGWTTDIVVQAFVVNVTDAADPDKDGLIQPLLRRWQAGGCSLSVFGLPAIQSIINFKWHAFARKMLLWQLSVFCIWIFVFYMFTALFQDENLSLTLIQLLETRRGLATVACELIACAAMTPFLILEQGTISAYGIRGWMNIWNGLDILTYSIQITVTSMHISRTALKSNALSILLALQCILLLFRLQYYSRVFKNTRFAFLEAIRDVIIEIRHYFLFLLLMMIGFASCFHVLFRRDQAVSGFDTMPHAFLKVYSQQNGLDFDEMLNSHVPVAASLLNIAYAFIMGMILVNLLIGIMGNALNKVTEHEALKLFLHKAQIIDELESTLPRWIEDKFESKWYPKFIHVLRIDPDKVDRVDLNALWSSKEGEDGKSSSTVLEARLDEIQALLAKLVDSTTNNDRTRMDGGASLVPVTPALPDASLPAR